MRRSANRTRLATLAGVLTAVGLLGLTAVALLLRYGPMPAPIIGETPFDAQEWRDSDPNNSSNLRLRMARNLERRGVLIGKTRSEVEAMLGTPMADDERPAVPTLYYKVGIDWFDLMPEPIFLALEFAGGKVVAIWYARS